MEIDTETEEEDFVTEVDEEDFVTDIEIDWLIEEDDSSPDMISYAHRRPSQVSPPPPPVQYPLTSGVSSTAKSSVTLNQNS